MAAGRCFYFGEIKTCRIFLRSRVFISAFDLINLNHYITPMQTALHIYALVRELNDRIIGSSMSGTEFYKKGREAYILFKTDHETLALGMAYHPIGFGAFVIPRGKIEIKSDEKPWPFFQIVQGGHVAAVSQFGLDRIFRIDINKDEKNYSIITEAIGPHGNIWLIDSGDKVVATLRHKKFDSSDKYHPPQALDKLNPLQMTLEQFTGGSIKRSEPHPGAISEEEYSGVG